MKTIQYEKLPMISSVKYRHETVNDIYAIKVHECIDDVSWKCAQSNSLVSGLLEDSLILNIKDITDEMLIYE